VFWAIQRARAAGAPTPATEAPAVPIAGGT
jgi:hypothetical protein